VKNYKKIYLDAFGKDETDFFCSEISKKPAIDIHHIECKGMGGDPNREKDRIENLMAVTREEHNLYGDKRQFMAFLYRKHLNFLELYGVKFDKEYIIQKIEQYELCTL
jgi:hypothetical protein